MDLSQASKDILTDFKMRRLQNSIVTGGNEELPKDIQEKLAFMDHKIQLLMHSLLQAQEENSKLAARLQYLEEKLSWVYIYILVKKPHVLIFDQR